MDIRETHRVRRWDVVVVGGALPGLVAAARLAARGARVLVIEEDSAVDAFGGLGEPFLMTGASSESVLGACLTAIGIPLIDRRALNTEPVAYQVVWPGARINIGDLDQTVEEIKSWGLAESQQSRELLNALEASATAEGARLMAAQLVSTARRSSRGARSSSRSQTAADTSIDRAVEQAISVAPAFAQLMDAQSRALADYGNRGPTAAARNRLIGVAMGGAVTVSGKNPWLASLLRRRIEARHGEFRRFAGPFRIVQTSNLPAVIADESSDVSSARALIINAPTSLLVEMGRHTAEPGDAATEGTWLRASTPTGRRLRLHLRGSRKLLAAGMANRVICVRDPAAPMTGTNVVRVRVFDDGEEVDLLADACIPTDSLDDDRVLEDIGRSVVSLMPLGDEGWSRVAVPEPVWDRSDLLCDPNDNSSNGRNRSNNNNNNPPPALIRPLPRVPAYVLDRSQSAQRGFEGDLLLGWQAGDAIAAELG